MIRDHAPMLGADGYVRVRDCARECPDCEGGRELRQISAATLEEPAEYEDCDTCGGACEVECTDELCDCTVACDYCGRRLGLKLSADRLSVRCGFCTYVSPTCVDVRDVPGVGRIARMSPWDGGEAMRALMALARRPAVSSGVLSELRKRAEVAK